ncbi:MAG: arginine N-succinyltransferase [Phycisphaerae bacterium]|nr:arginine N-succinyltransferase [Phycisphaerae bacterium]
MFVIRRAKIEDVPTLLKLARMVHFINLPADKDILTEKTQWSRQCFLLAGESVEGLGSHAGTVADSPEHRAESTAFASGLRALTGRSPLFMFVMEDTESASVVGTSQLIAAMGGPGRPNLSWQLSRREMFSQSLQIGTSHVTARLHLDESGPTELGGLILQPSARGHRQKLGAFLSLVRFHFIGLHRGMFADRVLAELMAPMDGGGQNHFWEYFSRRFINLTYDEADRFCQHSKEFMLNLLPREEIYLTLLPPEARAVVGQVGPETAPAKRMLEKLGFAYHNRIDPFDGGPNLEADTDSISMVRATDRATLGAPMSAAPARRTPGFVSVMLDDGDFRCVRAEFGRDRRGRVQLARADMDALAAEPGMPVGVTDLTLTEFGPGRTPAPATKPIPAATSRARSARPPRRRGGARERGAGA